MAFDISPYMGALAVGGQVSDITGNITDAATAGSYSAFVQSITGSVPTIVRLDSNRVKLVLTKEQASKLSSWLNDTIVTLMKPSPTPLRVEYELTPAIMPVVMRYTLPVGIGLFVAGMIAARLLFK